MKVTETVNFPVGDALHLLGVAANLVCEEMRRDGGGTHAEVACLLHAQMGIDQASAALTNFQELRQSQTEIL